MAFGSPPALLGFVGYVRFEFPDAPVFIRATTANIALAQDITKPNVIDGRFDKSVYQLGPQTVQGDIEYPAIMERVGDVDPTARLYKACVGRETNDSPRFGQLQNANIFNIGVRYTSQFAEFRYNTCLVNTFRFSVQQQEEVKLGVGLIGISRDNAVIGPMLKDSPGFPKNTRVVTWNDAVVNIKGGAQGSPSLSGSYIRKFEVTYDNHAERYYTLNGQLFPQDIAVGKRDIDGSFEFMGRSEQLSTYAITNQNRCYEDSTIQYGYELSGTSCNSTFLVTLPNIIYHIEEIALTNDLFVTTVKWHSMPDDLDLTDSDFLETGGAVI